MNKKFLVLSFVVLVTFSVFGLSAMANEPVNLLNNGSFEDLDRSGFPVGWPTNEFDQKIEISVDRTVVGHGNYSMRVKGSLDTGYARGPRGGVRQAISVAGDPTGTRYRFRALYRTDGVVKADGVQFRLYFNDVANQTIHQLPDDPTFRIVSVNNARHRLVGSRHLHLDAAPSPGEWTEVDVTFVAPLGTARVFMSMFLWHDTGTVWFDDVRFERVAD